MNTDQSPQPVPFIDLRRWVLRWLISTLAIFAAVWSVPGIRFEGPGWQLGIVALFFGLLNVLLRPFTVLLTIFTLGLFGLVVNALLLTLSSALADYVGIQFRVESFWSAFLGGLIIAVVSLVLGYLSGDQRIMIRVQHGDGDGDKDKDDDHNHDHNHDQSA
ncbi:MAG: phage holin family protein [Chloroflexaceae bacterium]|nr:phage holin family protein [Chloroflexaceae bacterium]